MSVSEVDVALIDDFPMSTMTRAAEPVRTDFERREPRCRICRDETVRVLVNKLLDWQGAPIILAVARLTWSPTQISCVTWSL